MRFVVALHSCFSCARLSLLFSLCRSAVLFSACLAATVCPGEQVCAARLGHVCRPGISLALSPDSGRLGAGRRAFGARSQSLSALTRFRLSRLTAPSDTRLNLPPTPPLGRPTTCTIKPGTAAPSSTLRLSAQLFHDTSPSTVIIVTVAAGLARPVPSWPPRGPSCHVLRAANRRR